MNPNAPTNARCRAPNCAWAVIAPTEAGAQRELVRHHNEHHRKEAGSVTQERAQRGTPRSM